MRKRPPCTEWVDKLGQEDLSIEDSAALDAHLRLCEACRTALTDYNFLIGRIRALSPPTVKPLPRLPFEVVDDAKNTEEGRDRLVRHGRQSYRIEDKASSSKNQALSSGLLIACVLIISLLLFRAGHNSRSGVRTIGTTITTYTGHANWVHTVVWSPDGINIASNGDDHTVRVWNARTGDTVFVKNTGSSSALAWSPDGIYIAIVEEDHSNTILIENIKTGQIAFTYKDHGGSVSALAWSPDGNYIVSADDDNTVQVWNVSKRSTLFTSSYSSVSALAWSPDTSRIALASFQGMVQVWNARTGNLVSTYTGHTGSVSAVAWSPDGALLASASYDNTVQIWDARNGKTIFTYREHTASVSAVAWSPDGSDIASGGDDSAVRVWDARTGKTIFIYKEYSGSVSAIAWSPKGGYIASSAENVIRVWSTS